MKKELLFMNKEISLQKNFMQNFNDFIAKNGFENFKTTINSKTGTMSISGRKGNIQYTTTMSVVNNGKITTQTEYPVNLGKAALVSQVKDLIKAGYRQQKVADMLGVSQSLVSKYSRMK